MIGRTRASPKGPCLRVALIVAQLLVLCTDAAIAATQSAALQRCGWFDNPSPGNATLFDKDGEWIVAIQAGHQAKGAWPPKFLASQWIRTGTGSAGYGCACFRVRTDDSTMKILQISSAVARPLKSCRNDRSLNEPFNPLK